MASFEILSSAAFLQKLLEDRDDFTNSHNQSSRHALNAIITAYHLHEWVWEEFKLNQHFSEKMMLKSSDKPCDFLLRLKSDRRFCNIDLARRITNGTKHFRPTKIQTGKHQGTFQPGAFQPDAFDVSYLWVESEGGELKVQDFIRSLVGAWEGFFEEHQLLR